MINPVWKFQKERMRIHELSETAFVASINDLVCSYKNYFMIK